MARMSGATDPLTDNPAASAPLSLVLLRLAQDGTRERIAVGDLLRALGDRALGALIFIFAVPNAVPAPPGLSTVLGAPLLFLSVQLMFGLRPWLPAFVAKRSISREDLATLMHRVVPWLARAEKLLRPRVRVLAGPPAEYMVGLVCLLLAVILVLPIPLGNVLPALAISLMALGVLERDGLWVLGGLLMAVVSVAVVYGVLFAMAQAAFYLLARWMG
jgi:hypothetical protein